MNRLTATAITIILILLFNFECAPAQEKEPAFHIGQTVAVDIIRVDSTGAIHVVPLDSRIAAYEKHLDDLQKDYQASLAILQELKALQTQLDTLGVASTKKEKK